MHLVRTKRVEFLFFTAYERNLIWQPQFEENLSVKQAVQECGKVNLSGNSKVEANFTVQDCLRILIKHEKNFYSLIYSKY